MDVKRWQLNGFRPTGQRLIRRKVYCMCGEGKLLLVSDCCLYLSLELRGDFPNPVLFCVFRGILQHFLFSVPPYNMCASGRWINLGALNDFPHGSSSSLVEPRYRTCSL